MTTCVPGQNDDGGLIARCVTAVNDECGGVGWGVGGSLVCEFPGEW